MKSKPYPELFWAIGLMSGTSIDGIDAALLETDGHSHVRAMGFMPSPYDGGFRQKLRRFFGNDRGIADPDVAELERDLTQRHVAIVRKFLAQLGMQPRDIDLIGFHGQTLVHLPQRRLTIQIGDGAMLARETGIATVNNFRVADVMAGGNGAPLVPLYHAALAARLNKPVAILNIGGVSNVTWIGARGVEDILAYDVGPGNALIDDWMLRHTNRGFDEDGALAATGTYDEAAVANVIATAFFAKVPPKSLDRDEFAQIVGELVPDHVGSADGAATLTRITAAAIACGIEFMPAKPKQLFVTGGGRHNKTLMRWIADLTGIDIRDVDELGWSGDGLEAEAFAYLAVRSKLALPLSMPRTTGVPGPTCGGILHKIT